MDKAISSLIVSVLSQPVFLILFLIGIVGIIVSIIKKIIEIVLITKRVEDKNGDNFKYNTSADKVCPRCGGSLKERERKVWEILWMFKLS